MPPTCLSFFLQWRIVSTRRSPAAIGETNMAKGMDKRKRDEKKPKKQKPKTNASAPSTKDVVSAAVAAKGK
tara:strand:+ start:481 stop:693 length:213 start_codon:yes stop_codon:yes gene_type:complete